MASTLPLNNTLVPDFVCICREKANNIGDACNAVVGNPMCTTELICVTGDSANVCYEKQIAQPGNSCGWLSNDAVTLCAFAGECDNGRCASKPVEGSACNSMAEGYYNWCVWPQKCVNGACVAPSTYAEACEP